MLYEMTEPEMSVSPREADLCLKNILRSDSFVGGSQENERRRRIMTILYEQWKHDETTVMSAKSIAEKLGLSLDESDAAKVRLSIRAIRENLLPHYYARSTDALDFSLPTPQNGRSYRLVIRRRSASRQTTIPDPQELPAFGSPMRGSNLAGVTAKRGANNEILVSGIEKVADVMGDSLRALPILDQLGRVYEAQHIDRHSEYIKCSTTVTARSLLNRGVPESALPDLIHYSAVFGTLEDPIHCRCISVSTPQTAGSVERLTCSVLHLGTETEFKTEIIPVRSRHASRRKEWLVFFEPVLPARSGPYRMDVQYLVPEFLKPLRETGEDRLMLYLRRQPGKKVTVRFILYSPAAFKRVVMMPREGSAPGRAMTRRELIEHGSPPPGFNAVGWTDMEPNEGMDYGVDLKCE